jgi:hypothetical protein
LFTSVASWILYSVLNDLVDEVDEELEQSFSWISVEIGLYRYSRALARGEQASLAEYFASRARLWGTVKAPRKKPFRT